MHIVTHAVGKITLFFCAGAIYVATHKKNISEMQGLGRVMPFTFGAFLIASVSIIGLPPGGGAWSKWFLAIGTVETEQYFLTAALMISSLLNIAYLIPISIRAFIAPVAADADSDHADDSHVTAGIKEAPMMCVVPLCITAIGSVLLFFCAEWIYEVLLPIAELN